MQLMTSQVANDFLKMALSDLKDHKPNSLDDVVREVNHILNRAIIDIPHEVNAVEMDLEMDTHRDPKNGYEERGRRMAKLLAQSIKNPDEAPYAELPGSVPFKVVKNLPYSDNVTRTQPPGKFMRHLSLIRVNANEVRDGKCEQAPLIGVSTRDHPWDSGESYALFYPDEINGIKFVNAQDFDLTKLVLHTPTKDVIIPATSTLKHYLAFRGFVQDISLDNNKHKQKMSNRGIPEEVMDQAEYIVLPEERSGLFRLLYNPIDGTRADGYVVQYVGSQPVLHRFNKFGLEDLFFWQAFDRLVTASAAVVKSRNSIGSDHQVYYGKDIVRRLSQDKIF